MLKIELNEFIFYTIINLIRLNKDNFRRKNVVRFIYPEMTFVLCIIILYGIGTINFYLKLLGRQPEVEVIRYYSVFTLSVFT